MFSKALKRCQKQVHVEQDLNKKIYHNVGTIKLIFTSTDNPHGNCAFPH